MTVPPAFTLFGAAGFVSARHIDAIHAIGGRLVGACDPHDAVGVLDRYGEPVQFHAGPAGTWGAAPGTDFVVLATPNDLHASQATLAMEAGADVICEKPAALTVAQLDAMLATERRTGRHVWVMHQLRMHPGAREWRDWTITGRRYRVHVDYATPRGPWYWQSWKGDPQRSGGLAMNLGVHLFDLLLWLFGDVQFSEFWKDRDVNPRAMTGRLVLDRADVTWSLSTLGSEPRRVMTIDGSALDLSTGFGALHAAVYREILAGRWHSLAEARPAIALCESLGTGGAS